MPAFKIQPGEAPKLSKPLASLLRAQQLASLTLVYASVSFRVTLMVWKWLHPFMGDFSPRACLHTTNASV